MKSSNRPLLRSALLLLLPLCGAARADWVQATDPLVIRALPDNMQTQAQNPPTFSWSRHPSAPPEYVVQVYLEWRAEPYFQEHPQLVFATASIACW